MMCHHVMEEKRNNKLSISSAVAIILGPALVQACTIEGKPPPITSPSNSEFPGIMIGVTLRSPNSSNRSTDTYYLKDKGYMQFLLCSFNHPVEHAN